MKKGYKMDIKYITAKMEKTREDLSSMLFHEPHKTVEIKALAALLESYTQSIQIHISEEKRKDEIFEG